MHPDEPRELYEGELKRLGGYPDPFQFAGKWNDVLNRVGNSVPPLLMYAIAEKIGSALTGVPLPLQQKTSYLATLEAAWAQHRAPRDADAPTVISTFAGCGGSSLGYSMAGFRELLAVEWDDNAVATFGLNFPEVPVHHGDIAQLSVEAVLAQTGLQPGELDVFDGSPPCQGFSTAGKRVLDDPRNGLFREYVRLLRGLQPKVFVMENVSGMVKGKMKLVFAEILRDLKASGYQVSARLLNAMYFHVPQSRERMIFIGVRNDLGRAPSHPKAQRKPYTIRDALPWITSVYHDSMGNEGQRIFNVDKEPICTIRVAKGGAQTRFYVESDADISKYKIGAKWEAMKPGQSIYYGGRLWKPDIDKPCPTITEHGEDVSASSVVHPTEKRKFYSWELKRLASFPDDFAMAGTWRDAWSRIGNSVPPLFMRAIAQHIREHLL